MAMNLIGLELAKPGWRTPHWPRARFQFSTRFSRILLTDAEPLQPIVLKRDGN